MQEIASGGFQIMWKRYSVLLISTIWNASMTFDQWPYFPSYGAYFRNVGEVTR